MRNTHRGYTIKILTQQMHKIFYLNSIRAMNYDNVYTLNSIRKQNDVNVINGVICIIVSEVVAVRIMYEYR